MANDRLQRAIKEHWADEFASRCPWDCNWAFLEGNNVIGPTSGEPDLHDCEEIEVDGVVFHVR